MAAGAIIGAVGSIGAGIGEFFGARYGAEAAETQKEAQSDWIEYLEGVRDDQLIPGVSNWIIFVSLIVLLVLAIFLIYRK